MIKLHTLAFTLGVFFIGSVSAEMNLVKFYEGSEGYYLVPPSKIQLFNFNKEDKELIISLDGHGGTIWRVSIENVSEKDLFELTNNIYSKNRKDIFSIKIDSVN